MRTLLRRYPLLSRLARSSHPDPVAYRQRARSALSCGAVRFYSDDAEEDGGFEVRNDRSSNLYKRIRIPEWEDEVNADEDFSSNPIYDMDRYSDRIVPHDIMRDEYNAHDITQHDPPPETLDTGLIVPFRIKDMLSHPRYVAVEPTMEQYHGTFPIGILPRREISRERYAPYYSRTEIEPGDEYKMVILQLIENLDGTGRMTPVVSIRRVAPILPESFQPATLAVFNVPLAMSEPYVRNYFLNFGPILEVRAFPSAHPDRPNIRTYTRIVYERKADAIDAMQDLRRNLVPLVIDGRTWDHVRLKAKFDVYEGDNYRREMQTELLEEHQQSMEWWTATPQTRYLRRKCFHEYIKYLMPYWDPESHNGEIQ